MSTEYCVSCGKEIPEGMQVCNYCSEGFSKDRECIHCERFFDCAGKPRGVKSCLNFKESK